MTFTLAHLSDAHIGPLPRVTLKELGNKRGLGYINWRRGRGRAHDMDLLRRLVADLVTQRERRGRNATTESDVSNAIPLFSGTQTTASLRIAFRSPDSGSLWAQFIAARDAFAENAYMLSLRDNRPLLAFMRRIDEAIADLPPRRMIMMTRG